ncbi:MAG: DegV family protein [Clostridiales bacterium]|jgi:DegV family protein with EDD domain|nr:DegV family protein [Clostridiales bacterium]HOC08387.1 DegV family protein [Bacillota bacterium]HQA47306.1 DegV family protein [Bacillota bacterium]HQD41741.1 DegV family protein [Bacillota bacterium]
MDQIRIVTDSTCDLPDEVLKEYNIAVAPLTVRFGQQSFKDRVEITTKEFFEKMGKSKEVPSTSQVSVGEFTDIFKALGENGGTVLGLFLSSRLSGTYQSAVIARNVLGLENIHVMDTKLTTLAQGLVVLKAAQMARNGHSLQEIKDMVTYMSDNMYSIIILGTLTYVEKGGRIGAGTALVGNLLNIMPVVTFSEGEVKLLGKIRGRKRTVSWLVNHIENLGIRLKDRVVGINYIGDSKIVGEVKDALKKGFNAKEFVVGTVGSVIGTYSGPDMALGVYFIK